MPDILENLRKEIKLPETDEIFNPGGTGKVNTGINNSQAVTTNPQTFIYNTAFVLLWALSILAVLTFIYAGVKYLTAGGDTEKAESGKKIMIGSIIGMLLVIGSFIIFNTAVSVLNQTNSDETTQQVLDKTYR